MLIDGSLIKCKRAGLFDTHNRNYFDNSWHLRHVIRLLLLSFPLMSP